MSDAISNAYIITVSEFLDTASHVSNFCIPFSLSDRHMHEMDVPQKNYVSILSAFLKGQTNVMLSLWIMPRCQRVWWGV